MLQWNVFRHDSSGNQIETFNIFDHGGFLRDVRETAKTIFEYDEFVKTVRSNLMYHFWTKCEYEVSIRPIVSDHKNTHKKVDVFTQVWNNKDAFVWYCLANRNELSGGRPVLPGERWFGIVKWAREDIIEQFREFDVEPTDDMIEDIFCECSNNHHFTDQMIEAGWESLRTVVSDYLNGSE